MEKCFETSRIVSTFRLVLFLTIWNYQFNYIFADSLTFREDPVCKRDILDESNDLNWLQEARLVACEERRLLEIVFSNSKSSETGLETEHRYKNITAIIREGKALYSEERAYRKKRLLKVQRALELLFKRRIPQQAVPIIAIVASGGGYRAMNGLMGSLLGAEKIGLLDACTYLVTLSGSTWLVAPWILSGLSLEAYKKVLKNKVARAITSLNPKKVYWITKALLAKRQRNQPVGFVDFYGALLASRLLEEHHERSQQIGLSEQREKIETAKYPFPIYTAVRAELYAPSQWYEFTPYEIGGSWLKRFVPTWAYGRLFNAGISIDDAPEQSLGFQLGTFGSSMGATIQNIYEYFNTTFISELLPDAFKQDILAIAGQKRFLWAEVNNFVKAMPETKLSHVNSLKLIDAGARPGFNLPYPPVSEERPERKADIIIMLDYSYPLEDAAELRKAEEYARERSLKFPVINYLGISKRLITVFKDDYDPEIPVIIYMPLYHDIYLWEKLSVNSSFSGFKQYLDNFDLEKETKQGYCSTFNFKYTHYQFEQLTALTEFALRVSSDQIMRVIWEVILKKYRKIAEKQDNFNDHVDDLVDQVSVIP